MQSAFDLDASGLSARGLALYEYFVGCLITRAFEIRGRRPKRSIPPVLALLIQLVGQYDSTFDALPDRQAWNCHWRIDGPNNTHKQIELKFPAGWKSSFISSPERALGQMFIERTNSRRKGGQKSARTRREFSTREKIIAAAIKLKSSGAARRTWRNTLASRLDCSPQYVGRVLAEIDL